jgi:hypothetical protein
MPLLSQPGYLAAMDNGLHLEFSKAGIAVPPSKLHTHGKLARKRLAQPVRNQMFWTH